MADLVGPPEALLNREIRTRARWVRRAVRQAAAGGVLPKVLRTGVVLSCLRATQANGAAERAAELEKHGEAWRGDAAAPFGPHDVAAEALPAAFVYVWEGLDAAQFRARCTGALIELSTPVVRLSRRAARRLPICLHAREFEPLPPLQQIVAAQKLASPARYPCPAEADLAGFCRAVAAAADAAAPHAELYEAVAYIAAALCGIVPIPEDDGGHTCPAGAPAAAVAEPGVSPGFDVYSAALGDVVRWAVYQRQVKGARDLLFRAVREAAWAPAHSDDDPPPPSVARLWHAVLARCLCCTAPVEEEQLLVLWEALRRASTLLLAADTPEGASEGRLVGRWCEAMLVSGLSRTARPPLTWDEPLPGSPRGNRARPLDADALKAPSSPPVVVSPATGGGFAVSASPAARRTLTVASPEAYHAPSQAFSIYSSVPATSPPALRDSSASPPQPPSPPPAAAPRAEAAASAVGIGTDVVLQSAPAMCGGAVGVCTVEVEEDEDDNYAEGAPPRLARPPRLGGNVYPQMLRSAAANGPSSDCAAMMMMEVVDTDTAPPDTCYPPPHVALRYPGGGLSTVLAALLAATPRHPPRPPALQPYPRRPATREIAVQTLSVSDPLAVLLDTVDGGGARCSALAAVHSAAVLPPVPTGLCRAAPPAAAAAADAIALKAGVPRGARLVLMHGGDEVAGVETEPCPVLEAPAAPVSPHQQQQQQQEHVQELSGSGAVPSPAAERPEPPVVKSASFLEAPPERVLAAAPLPCVRAAPRLLASSRKPCASLKETVSEEVCGDDASLDASPPLEAQASHWSPAGESFSMGTATLCARPHQLRTRTPPASTAASPRNASPERERAPSASDRMCDADAASESASTAPLVVSYSPTPTEGPPTPLVGLPGACAAVALPPPGRPPVSLLMAAPEIPLVRCVRAEAEPDDVEGGDMNVNGNGLSPSSSSSSSSSSSACPIVVGHPPDPREPITALVAAADYGDCLFAAAPSMSPMTVVVENEEAPDDDIPIVQAVSPTPPPPVTPCREAVLPPVATDLVPGPGPSPAGTPASAPLSDVCDWNPPPAGSPVSPGVAEEVLTPRPAPLPLPLPTPRAAEDPPQSPATPSQPPPSPAGVPPPPRSPPAEPATPPPPPRPLSPSALPLPAASPAASAKTPVPASPPASQELVASDGLLVTPVPASPPASQELVASDALLVAAKAPAVLLQSAAPFANAARVCGHEECASEAGEEAEQPLPEDLQPTEPLAERVVAEEEASGQQLPVTLHSAPPLAGGAPGGCDWAQEEEDDEPPTPLPCATMQSMDTMADYGAPPDDPPPPPRVPPVALERERAADVAPRTPLKVSARSATTAPRSTPRQPTPRQPTPRETVTVAAAAGREELRTQGHTKGERRKKKPQPKVATDAALLPADGRFVSALRSRAGAGSAQTVFTAPLKRRAVNAAPPAVLVNQAQITIARVWRGFVGRKAAARRRRALGLGGQGWVKEKSGRRHAAAAWEERPAAQHRARGPHPPAAEVSCAHPHSLSRPSAQNKFSKRMTGRPTTRSPQRGAAWRHADAAPRRHHFAAVHGSEWFYEE